MVEQDDDEELRQIRVAAFGVCRECGDQTSLECGDGGIGSAMEEGLSPNKSAKKLKCWQ